MNNKIMKWVLKPAVFACIFLWGICRIDAQNLPVSPYGLAYINSISLYQKSLENHPEKLLISLSQIPGVILDLRYASDSNFTHKKLYPANTKKTYLRKPAFQALDSVANEMARHGQLLVIFDAYRPYSVTVSLWNSIKDERYAANPAKGSGHNRGLSVDLSLADAKTHQLLNMPTCFDNFSDSAHQDFKLPDMKRPGTAGFNRDLLRKTMEKYGFESLPTEWWHFSWPHSEDYEVLDLSFQQLDALNTNTNH
jgi:zinc D-Ala-D-Ala dipeptidase